VSSDESEPIDEQFASRLAAYDEALAAGAALPVAGAADTPPELEPRLQRGLECLRFLEEMWPRHNATDSHSPVGPGVPSEAIAGQLSSGSCLGRFQIRREVGRGTFGVVYLAYDPHVGREVALKIARADALADPRMRERFRREAQAAGRLDHPHIVPVHDADEAGSVCFIVSAYCPGCTLAECLSKRKEPLSIREAAGLIATLALAVQHAHDRGVLHRDLKPANVLLQMADGSTRGEPNAEQRMERSANFDLQSATPKIADFGLAKFFVEPGGSGTESGAVVGTPNYMAPEQAGGRSKEISPATDVYGLGAILYELLTGRVPFQGETTLDTLLAVRTEEPVSPSRLRRGLPRDLETICLKAMAKRPVQRYATARQMAEDLQRYLNGQPIEARPVSIWERGLAWMRRKPGAAALVGVSGLAALALVGVVVGTWYNGRLRAALQEAEEQRTIANQQREEAHAQRARAEAQEEKSLYFGGMEAAYQAWQEGKLGLALLVLNYWQPIAEGPSGLSGWELYYLRSLCHKDFHSLKGNRDLVSVAVSPDGRLVAAASWVNVVHLWDRVTGKQVGTFTGHRSEVQQVVFSPDGGCLASAGSDGTVRIWQIPTGNEIRTLEASTEPVRSVAFSPDGRYLIAGGWDKLVRLWDTSDWRQRYALVGHTAPIMKMTFSPDGRRIASVSHDRTVRLWDVASGRQIQTFTGHSLQVSGIAFSPDGQTLASSSEDETIRLWDLATGTGRWTLTGHKAWVYDVAFNPDGRRLVSAGFDNTVRLWDAQNGHELCMLVGHTAGACSVTFCADGRWLLSSSFDGTVKFWDTESSSQEYRSFLGHRGPVVRAVFTPDGRHFVSAGRDGTARLWDLASGQQIRAFRHQTKEAWGLALSPDGRQLATAGFDGSVKLWDVATGQLLRTLLGHQGHVVSVTFSPDGRRLASGSHDSTVKLWDAENGQEIYTLRGHAARVEAIAFSPDGRLLVSASMDKTLRLWDVETGQERHTLSGHVQGVVSVAFSPDGRQLVSGGADATVRFWDPATGQEVRGHPGHVGAIVGLAFTPDGKRLATASQDKTIKILEAARGHPIITLRGATSPVNAVAFSPDGRQLLSSSADGTIRLWDSALDEESKPSRLQKMCSPEQRIAWHRKQVQECEAGRQWFAALFHLNRLIDARPADWLLRLHRGRAYLGLGHQAKALADYTEAVSLLGAKVTGGMHFTRSN
jgi:WD40 repeat protein